MENEVLDTEEVINETNTEKVLDNGKVLDNDCPLCGAPIKFNPSLGKFKCDFCRGEFTLDELKKHINNASTDKVNDGVNGDDTIYETYKCSNCGAEIVADENTAATFCLYCRSVAILKSKLSGKFAPTKIIPFKKEKNDAISAFKGLRKGRPLIPRYFLSQDNIEKITGIYIPFWLYNINVSGGVNFICKNIKSWTSGDIHYTKTDTYSAVREGSIDFNLVPVDGSTRFDDDIMNSIEPFDYKELVDYNHAYLSGFLAEKYDVETEKALPDALKRSVNSTTDKFKSSVRGYSSVAIKTNTLEGKETSKEYALLPVWMVNVKYGNKFYLFAMNGQTGEFIGNIPVDKKKALLFWLISFAITFGLVVLISYIVFKG